MSIDDSLLDDIIDGNITNLNNNNTNTNNTKDTSIGMKEVENKINNIIKEN